MKCLPYRGWDFSLSRTPNWAALGFDAQGKFNDGAIDAQVFGTRRPFVQVHTKLSKRRVYAFMRRLCRTKRGCKIMNAEVFARFYQTKIPFYFDVFALLRYTTQSPELEPMPSWLLHDLLCARDGHMNVIINRASHRSTALHRYNTEVLPFVREFECSKTDAMRIKRLIGLSGDDLWRAYEHEVVRARECDRVLALVPRMGDPAIMWRVSEFLWHN